MKVLVTQSCPTLCDPPGTVALQASLSMGFPSQSAMGKVMSLLFNMLSRLVITFLPRTKASFNKSNHNVINPHKTELLITSLPLSPTSLFSLFYGNIIIYIIISQPSFTNKSNFLLP